MEFLIKYQFLLPIGQFILSVLTLVFIMAVKFNDLKHLQKDFEEFKNEDFKKLDNKVEKYGKRTYNLAQRTARLEGKVINGKATSKKKK